MSDEVVYKSKKAQCRLCCKMAPSTNPLSVHNRESHVWYIHSTWHWLPSYKHTDRLSLLGLELVDHWTMHNTYLIRLRFSGCKWYEKYHRHNGRWYLDVSVWDYRHTSYLNMKNFCNIQWGTSKNGLISKDRNQNGDTDSGHNQKGHTALVKTATLLWSKRPRTKSRRITTKTVTLLWSKQPHWFG